MKITLKNAWIKGSASKYGTCTSAILEVDGVGEVSIDQPLPADLQADIESFFQGILYKRMKGAQAEKEPANLIPFRPQPMPPTNPSTLEAMGVEV
jgi:hypothetical protein